MKALLPRVALHGTLATGVTFSACSAQQASTSPRQRPDAHARSINATRFSCRAAANGGPGRDRTGDLIVANDALSQLSYSPTCLGMDRGDFITCNIRAVYRSKFEGLTSMQRSRDSRQSS